MRRNWIELDEGSNRATQNEIYASMNEQSHIVINGHTFRELREPEAFVLMFDPDTDTIGLRPASVATHNAYRVRNRGGRRRHRYVTAARLARNADKTD